MTFLNPPSRLLMVVNLDRTGKELNSVLRVSGVLLFFDRRISPLTKSTPCLYFSHAFVRDLSVSCGDFPEYEFCEYSLFSPPEN